MKLETLTGHTKQKQKELILTELYNSGQLQQKLEGILERHRIPKEADIQSDIIQTTFEHLTKYNTEKMLEAYYDNPKRILGLGVRILIKKNILQDNRTPGGYKHSTAPNILHLSNLASFRLNEKTDEEDYLLTTNYYLNHTDYTEQEETYNSLPAIGCFETDDEEERNIEMWEFIRNELTPLEEETLDYALILPPNKMRKHLKKDYLKLLPRLKQLITEFNNNY